MFKKIFLILCVVWHVVSIQADEYGFSMTFRRDSSYPQGWEADQVKYLWYDFALIKHGLETRNSFRGSELIGHIASLRS